MGPSGHDGGSSMSSLPHRNMGDYMVCSRNWVIASSLLTCTALQCDEDFNPSYENLLTLASTLGEVLFPRSFSPLCKNTHSASFFANG